MTFTKEELTFLYQLLDQLTIRGLDQKRKVVSIMEKIKAENGGVEPETPEPTEEAGA